MTVVAERRQLDPVGLAEVDATASLQTRTDRKYVVDEATLERLLATIASDVRVLEIDGRRSFAYRSLYFDTPEGDSYLGAARKRPTRFKVRTRTYVDTGTTWLEVKRRDRRGRTVKTRVASATPDSLDDADRRFVASFPDLADVADRLVPSLTTSYERTTLIVDGTRVTVDRNVRGTTPDGRSVAIDGLVVETKSERPGGPVDRALWSLGVRPLKLSKYCTSLAALRPELPANKWHRTLRRHVRVPERQ